MATVLHIWLPWWQTSMHFAVSLWPQDFFSRAGEKARTIAGESFFKKKKNVTYRGPGATCAVVLCREGGRVACPRRGSRQKRGRGLWDVWIRPHSDGGQPRQNAHRCVTPPRPRNGTDGFEATSDGVKESQYLTSFFAKWDVLVMI